MSRSPLPSPRQRRFAVVLAAAAALGAAACGTPADAEDHLRRGDAALEAGRYAEALAGYNRARELAPTDTKVQRAAMRGRLTLLAAEPGRITPDMIDDARYEAGVMLDVDPPRRAVYLTALANLALRAGDADEARAKLDEAVKADPSCAVAHAALGSLLVGKKETFAEGKRELEAALASNPRQVGALVGLAQVKTAEGDLAGAAEKLQAALKVRDDFGARMSLGGIYVQQQKSSDAAEQFQRAARLDPKSPDALGSLGQALLSTGRADEAERVLRSALDLRPDPATFTALGFALLRQKKPDQALEVFAKILDREPSAPPAHYGAGMAAEALGRAEDAVAHYRALLEMKPRAGDNKQPLEEMQQDARARLATIQRAALAAASATASVAASETRPGGSRRAP